VGKSPLNQLLDLQIMEPKIMTMEQFFRCTLPVISEHPEVEWKHSFGGTAFLVRYKDRLFAVTANHVIQTHHSDPHRICILSSPVVKEFLPLKEIVTPKIDASHADIAIIEIDEAKLSNPEIFPIKLDELNRSNIFDKTHSILCFRGYPFCLSEIDYENEIMKFCGYYAETSYRGLSSQALCHEIDFIDLSEVENLNGLSGSPLLHVIKTGSQSFEYDFAGMLIQGTKKSKIGHFIDSSAVYAALDWVITYQ
jgi:hypothetical protein